MANSAEERSERIRRCADASWMAAAEVWEKEVVVVGSSGGGGVVGDVGEVGEGNKDLTVLVLLGILRGKQSSLLCSRRGSSRSSWM